MCGGGGEGSEQVKFEQVNSGRMGSPLWTDRMTDTHD